MSNNRKRNMKKLARNIITGTALAMGGLANVPQMSAAEQNGGVDAAGQPTAGVNGATIAGIATGIGGLALTGASLIVNHRDSKATREQTRLENERRAKIDAATEDRAKQETDIKVLADQTGLAQDKAVRISESLNCLANRCGAPQKWNPALLRQVMKKGGDLTKRLILAADYGANTIDEGAESFTKEFRNVLCSTPAGNEVLKNILKAVPDSITGAAETRNATIVMSVQQPGMNAHVRYTVGNAAGNGGQYCTWLTDDGTASATAGAAVGNGAHNPQGTETQGVKRKKLRSSFEAVDKNLPENLKEFAGLLPIGFALGQPLRDAQAGRGVVYGCANGAFQTHKVSLDNVASDQGSLDNLKDGKCPFALTFGMPRSEVQSNANAHRHGVYPLDLIGAIGEIKAKDIEEADKKIRKKYSEVIKTDDVEDNIKNDQQF